MSEPLKVEYWHEIPGVGYGNIMWKQHHPMRNGRFPTSHPAAAAGKFGDAVDGQLGATDRMNAFRSLGYWASCFPEGDGITMKVLKDQSPETVASDIANIFGWQVTIKRGVTKL